jgi:hypothetical protein
MEGQDKGKDTEVERQREKYRDTEGKRQRRCGGRDSGKRQSNRDIGEIKKTKDRGGGTERG